MEQDDDYLLPLKSCLTSMSTIVGGRKKKNIFKGVFFCIETFSVFIVKLGMLF